MSCYILKKNPDGRFVITHINSSRKSGRVGRYERGNEIILGKPNTRFVLPRILVGRRFKMYIEFLDEKSIEIVEDGENMFLKDYTCDNCCYDKLIVKNDSRGFERPYCPRCHAYSCW